MVCAHCGADVVVAATEHGTGVIKVDVCPVRDGTIRLLTRPGQMPLAVVVPVGSRPNLHASHRRHD